MKLKKNVNMNSVVERFKELQNHCGTLASDFTKAIQILDDSKLGITELNYNIDEEVMRYRNTINKIEDLLKGF